MNIALNPQIKAVNRNLISRFGSFLLVASLVACIGLITVITLVYSTKQVTKGYQINSLDREKQNLVRQMEIIDMKISDTKSLKNISSSEKIKTMVRPGKLVFIKNNGSIASR